VRNSHKADEQPIVHTNGPVDFSYPQRNAYIAFYAKMGTLSLHWLLCWGFLSGRYGKC
jgi:hypothetical protein